MGFSGSTGYIQQLCDKDCLQGIKKQMKDLKVINTDSKLILAKTKTFLKITKKIVSRQEHISIRDYIDKEMQFFIHKIDQDDMGIMEQIVPDIMKPLFESIDDYDLKLWIKNLQKSKSKDTFESLLGGCLILTLCKYSEFSTDTTTISIDKLSKIFKKIVNDINDISQD